MPGPTRPGTDAPLTTPASVPGTPRPAEPTEAQMTRAILAAARITHWRVCHFRPGQTKHGWRTAGSGDVKGFPDLVMVHPGARLIWWVELKMKGGRLDAEQRAWRDDLLAVGADWRLVVGRVGLSDFIDDMALVPRMAGKP